jgi:hypothetical protein
VEAWTNCWSINNGYGISPKNSIEFLFTYYAF